ncbi:hypothetical protein EB796_010704 [Bugula neritina]|uniref:Uncharacterized protein n=1 Tax=Bugula neritina TaxID=10212 RepID=A0A7J7K060_BUGNE|nr:hypothetical protein EB796_019387 [Bugula neritina]KAF6030986.1 hypothetical protein EB796_010704 [Bugula neritina]
MIQVCGAKSAILSATNLFIFYVLTRNVYITFPSKASDFFLILKQLDSFISVYIILYSLCNIGIMRWYFNFGFMLFSALDFINFSLHRCIYYFCQLAM